MNTRCDRQRELRLSEAAWLGDRPEYFRRRYRAWLLQHNRRDHSNSAAIAMLDKHNDEFVELAPNWTSREVANNVFGEKYGARHDKTIDCAEKNLTQWIRSPHFYVDLLPPPAARKWKSILLLRT